ncbi:hypothetical protein PS1_029635 [Malus domestica]
MTDREKQTLNPAQVQPAACEELARLLETHHMHYIRGIDEPNTWKSSLDQQVMAGDSQKLRYPQQRQIQEEVEKLLTKRLHDFQRNEVTDKALRWNMTNITRSPFTDEIKQAEPPHEFNMLHFTSFKRDEDSERHLKRYRSVMILYRNNDDLMCKIFATTLQGDAQNWFYTLPPQSIRNFYELSLVFTKEYSSYRSIKKKSDHLFDVKKNPKESLRNYVRRFNVEKARIVKCNDSIARAVFQK